MNSWQTRARKARAKLKDAKHGEREARLREVAGADIDVNTVRREVFALNFLDTLKKKSPEMRRQLDETPLSIVEVLARWFVFDEEAATEAVGAVIRGRHNFASLNSALKTARLTRKAGAGGETLEAAHRKKMEQPAWHALNNVLGPGLSNATIQYKSSPDDPPIDFQYLLLKPGIKSQGVAALIVGPYQNDNLYHKRRHAWLWRAVALTLEFDHVALLIPGQKDADEYAKWIIQKSRLADAKPDGAGAYAASLYRKVLVLRPAGFEMAVVKEKSSR